MNILSKSVLTAVLTISSLSFANTTTSATDKPLSISAEITELLNNNHMQLETATTFQVTFVINNDKEIIITDVDTDNLEIKQFIKARLNNKKLRAATRIGQHYFLPVTIQIS